MKQILLSLAMALLPLLTFGQSVIVLNSLEMLPNSNALVKYNNEFGRFENKEIDDSFPYVVIRMELQGDVREAKTRLSLDLGSSYKIEAADKNRDNMILFLIPKGARSIYLLCGDGCEKQQLYYGTLQENKEYVCKVEYRKELAQTNGEGASNQDMNEVKMQNEQIQQQMEQMKQMLQQMNANQQQAPTAVDNKTEHKNSTATIEHGVLIKVPEDFAGNFVISDNVTSIGVNAFKNCTTLISVTIPNSVTSIGKGAFDGCKSLTSVTIPNSVTSIGIEAFNNCRNLISVNIPNSVTSIGKDVFHNCRSLTNVTIPDNVTSIGSGAFYSCKSLTNVNIPNSVTSIGESAFENCESLTSLTIPDSVTSIGGDAFEDCDGLSAIYVSIDSEKRIKKLLPMKLRNLVKVKK